MTTTSSPLHPAAARRPVLEHRPAMQLAAAEYGRMVETLAALDGDDWWRPTDCPDWDVRQLACHMVGMAAMASSPLETARQQRAAAKVHATRGGPMIDSLTAIQVSERETLSAAEIVDAARQVAPKAARGRRLTPSVVRRRTLPQTQQVNGVEEKWTIGFLLDVILTRDPWMHRIDLAQATGTELRLTAEHDGIIVDDVVHEWADRHGRPYLLALTGPAGGTWSRPAPTGDTPSISLDAIEFCRIVSGRATGVGLLSTQVPF